MDGQTREAMYNRGQEVTMNSATNFQYKGVFFSLAMRAQILEKIHSSHIGSEGCLRRAREVVF